MKILSLSTDENILEEGSEVRERMKWYGSLVEELHIIVLSQKSIRQLADKTQKFGNVFVYPTNSWSKIFCLFDAYRIGKDIIKKSLIANYQLLITAQDPFESGLIGYMLKKKFKLPLQIQIHTDFLSPYFWRESLKNKIRVLLAKFLLPKADGIRVVSERIKKSLPASASGGWRAKISVLPIFVDVGKIRSTSIKTDLHKKYPEYDFIILMASRLTREKNIGLAVEAMKEIVKEHPKTLLLIAGSGPEEKNLRLKACGLGFENSVKFGPWTDDLVSYCKTSDLFLLTSNYEGYSMSIVEAISAGLPVLATDVGIAEILPKELTFPVADKEALVEKLKKIIKDGGKKKFLPEIQNFYARNIIYASKDEYLTKCSESWRNCLDRKKVVCFFGSFDTAYSRNIVTRKGLSLNGVEVIECNSVKKARARFKYLELFRNYFRFCRECDVIFVPEFCQAFVPLAYLLSRMTGKPLIFDSFVSFYDSAVFDRKIVSKWSFKALYYYLFDRLSVRLADLVLVDTSQHKDYFHEKFGLKKEKMTVVHIGADDDAFYPKGEKDKSENFTVLFYGTYIPLHGIQYIIEAAGRIEKVDKSVRFIIVGKGQTYNEIQELHGRLSPKNIEFIKFLPWNELGDLIKNVDVCLGIFGDTEKASRVVPNKVYECLAAGKPVITGDSPAAREIFENKKHLILVRMADADSIAEAIFLLKRDEGLRRKISQEGYKLFKEKFSPLELGKIVKSVIERAYRGF